MLTEAWFHISVNSFSGNSSQLNSQMFDFFYVVYFTTTRWQEQTIFAGQDAKQNITSCKRAALGALLHIKHAGVRANKNH